MMTNSSSPCNLLDIAEIRFIISQLLADDPSTLFSCILVSRSWSMDFLPRLWHSIRFDHHLSTLITLTHFQKYQHLVRQLFINDPTFFLEGYCSDSCSNLTRLEYAPHMVPTLWYQLSTNELDVLRRLHVLVEQQNSLLHLEEDWSTLPMILWTPKVCPKLTTLHLSHWHHTIQCFNMMIANCPSLQCLSMRSCLISRQSIETPDYHSQSTLQLQPQKYDQQRLNQLSNSIHKTCRDNSMTLDFGTVRTLKLQQFYLQGEPIVVIGQQVETLEIDTHTLQYEHALTGRIYYNRKRRFSWWLPNVSSLKFTGRGGSIQGTDIGHFLESVISPPTTIFLEKGSYENLPTDTRDSGFCHSSRIRIRSFSEITLNDCHISSAMIKTVYLQYGKTISFMDLEGCTGLVSKDVGQIVIHCEGLRVFRGPETFFWTRDLSTLGWTSNNFQEFVVLIGIGMALNTDEEEKEEQLDISSVDMILSQDSTKRSLDMMYEMLSQQHELEVLDLSGAIDFDLGDCHQKGIPLVLKAGLEKLGTLKNIQRVIVTGWEQEMGQDEAYWMKTHWPKLEYIHSREGGMSEGWRQFKNNLDLPVKINTSF